jgi:RIO kinase 1
MGLKPDLRIDYTQLRKTWGGVFDEMAIQSLHKLMKQGHITEIKGVIKQGKESVVLNGLQGERPIAIKVYAIEAANFKRMQPYLSGDPRFKKIKPDRRSVVSAWAKKEFKNLERAAKAGVNCPEPLAVRDNVLVMSFIGDDFVSAPRLSECDVEEPQRICDKVIEFTRMLYRDAKIVHGDLSEFNILLWNGEPYIIDFSQSLVTEQQNAQQFLERDVHNIAKYFKRIGAECNEEDVLEKVTKK